MPARARMQRLDEPDHLGQLLASKIQTAHEQLVVMGGEKVEILLNKAQGFRAPLRPRLVLVQLQYLGLLLQLF